MGALASPRILHANPPSPSVPPALDLGRLVLSPARAGDHAAIHQLLASVFRGPSAAEFQIQQDEPGYSPSHRIVARDGQKVVGHARVSLREMQIGGQWLKVGRVFDLCVLPEFREQGVATHLLLACESLARSHGAALLQTRSPRTGLFERLGWFICGRHSYSLAGPREVLAEMERRRFEQAALHQPSDDLPQLSSARNPLTVRRWKQTEQAAVQRLYAEATAGQSGHLSRSEEYWRWLIARDAYDWFYVAIDGPDRTLFDDIQGHIVGYMFLKSNRILELMASPANDRAAKSLLARACRDAIEQSVTPLRIDGPAGCDLEELIVASGGKSIFRECDGSESFLLKALDLTQLATATLVDAPGDVRVTLQLREEAPTIPLHRGAKLPVDSGRWVIQQRELLPDGGTTRPQVICPAGLLGQLLLGHVSVVDALESSQLRASSRAAREALEQLFAPRTLWFPPLDDLLA
jgi:predicted N-acetyltransferase YhbS